LPPKKAVEEEKPMSEFARRRKEMEERRAAKQKELDQIKMGKFFDVKSLLFPWSSFCLFI
jgi:response regulator of citrate/malate metabolism